MPQRCRNCRRYFGFTRLIFDGNHFCRQGCVAAYQKRTGVSGRAEEMGDAVERTCVRCGNRDGPFELLGRDPACQDRTACLERYLAECERMEREAETATNN